MVIMCWPWRFYFIFALSIMYDNRILKIFSYRILIQAYLQMSIFCTFIDITVVIHVFGIYLSSKTGDIL